MISPFEDGYAEGYRSGQWNSLNRILHMLNTFEDKMIDKSDLYEQIGDLRPQINLPLSSMSWMTFSGAGVSINTTTGEVKIEEGRDLDEVATSFWAAVRRVGKTIDA